MTAALAVTRMNVRNADVSGLRVLLRIRSDIEKFPGGDYLQLLKTREALISFGVKADVLSGVAPLPRDYDLIHLFNTTRIHETAVQFRQARAQGVPVVVSPIWHSTAEMQRFYAHLLGWPRFPLTAYQATKEAWYARRSGLPIDWPTVLKFRAMQREVTGGADALLPNSRAELAILRSELGVDPRAAFVVPNGFTPIVPPAQVAPEPRLDVLCVGRIEPRKNQLSVIRAFKRLPRTRRRLVLYGAVNEGHAGYAARVRAELVPGWVEYAGCRSHAAVAEAFSRAAVLVLASFFETCGLVVLEALAGGAHACITRSRYLEDYYGRRVEYCDPYHEPSIAAGIAAALARPTEDHAEFLRGFLWQRAGEATLRAYMHVLGVTNGATANAHPDLVETLLDRSDV
jgi:glycosyltransferase involved in cell wall biosynthesis